MGKIAWLVRYVEDPEGPYPWEIKLEEPEYDVYDEVKKIVYFEVED